MRDGESDKKGDCKRCGAPVVDCPEGECLRCCRANHAEAWAEEQADLQRKQQAESLYAHAYDLWPWDDGQAD